MMKIESKYDRELKNNIVECLEESLGIPREYWEVMRTKKSDEVFIRKIYCFLLKEHTDFNLKKIADVVGYKDHGSVIRTVDNIKNSLALKPNDKVGQIIKEFKQIYETRYSNPN